MDNFVKTNHDIDAAIATVERLGWPLHRWNHFKNWEMLWLGDDMRFGDCLDIGCVTSMALEIAVFLGNPNRKVGLDPVVSYPTWAMPDGCEYVLGRAEALPFDDASFDVVTCLSVIEHDVDVDAFAREASRVLRPSGRLIVTFDFWPYPKHPAALGFGELLDLVIRLGRLGLTVEPITGTVQDKIVDGIYTLGALRATKSH